MPRTRKLAVWARCGPAALAASAVLATSPSSAAPEQEDSDGFRVNSSDSVDYQGTRQEVESNLTVELAEKLRQFDEWTIKTEEQSAASDVQGGATLGGVAGGGSSGSGGDGANASLSTSSPSSAADPAESAPNGWPQTTGDEGTNTVATTDKQKTELSQPAVQPPPRADRKAREDDVARMIREAAEQETDPVRKKALMEQYDAYLEKP